MLDAPFWIEPSGRAIITDTYGLRNDIDYTLAQYLLTSAWFDEVDPSLVVMPQEILRKLVPGRKSFEDVISSCPIPCDIVPHNHWKGKATCLRPHITKEVQNAVEDSVRNRYTNKHNKVNFRTGESWTGYQERKMWEQQAELMESYSVPGHPASKLIQYLHSPRARKAVRRLVVTNHDLIIHSIDNIPDQDKRSATYRLMLQIENSHLTYKSTGGTARIYAAGSSIMQLPREIREVLYTGCYSIDINSAQLCIIERLWNVPGLSEVAAAGVWTYLSGLLNVNLSRKPELKQMIYSTIFGGGKPLLREQSDLAEAYLSLPIIKKIWNKRQARLNEIRRLGYIVDAWGEIHYLGNVDKPTEGERVRSLLARQVQSYEVYIMLAGFESIANDEDVVMTGWLHDGFYIEVQDNKKSANSKLKRAALAIKTKAKELDINLETEIEFLR